MVAGLTLSAGSALAARLPAEFTRSCPTESPGGSYGADTPTYRASNIPSSIQFPQGVRLTLPTSEAGHATMGAG